VQIVLGVPVTAFLLRTLWGMGFFESAKTTLNNSGH